MLKETVLDNRAPDSNLDINPGADAVNAAKAAQLEWPIHPLLAARWSPRAFAARPVTQLELLSLFEAARWAPSSGNGQPWSFIVATPQDDPHTFRRLAGLLNPGNASWAADAPALILAAAQTTRNDAPHRIALFDLGLAVQNLTLQATAQGLHVHPMGGFDKDRAQAEFALPAGHEAVVMLAVGSLGSPEQLSEKDRERELAPRLRKPLRDFVFGPAWGTSWGEG